MFQSALAVWLGAAFCIASFGSSVVATSLGICYYCSMCSTDEVVPTELASERPCEMPLATWENVVGVWDLEWLGISYVMTISMAEEQKDAATLGLQADQGGEDWQGQMTLCWQDS